MLGEPAGRRAETGSLLKSPLPMARSRIAQLLAMVALAQCEEMALRRHGAA